MKEQLISFETAKLAKEKGFALMTVGSHQYNYFEEDGREGGISWGHLNLNNAAQVPQSLLQKWLREEHKIIVSVDINEEEKYFLSITGLGMYGEFKDWEQALEKGLQSALKLIIIENEL